MGQLKKFVAGGVAAAGMLFASQASALITNWDADFTNVFTNSVLWNGGAVTGNNTNQLRWGPAQTIQGESGLDVGSPVGPIDVVTNGGIFDTVPITHLNRVIGCTRGNPDGSPAANGPICLNALETTTIASQLTLTATAPPLGQEFQDTLGFEIRFAETFNGAPCGFPVDTVCDDIFALLTPIDALTFDLLASDGITYTVTIGVEGLGPLDPVACSRAGLAAGCFGFTTPEGQDTTILANIQITAPVDMPEPGVLAMLALSLMAAGVAVRRKRA